MSAPRPDNCQLICINQTTLLAYPRTFETGNFIQDNVRNYYSQNAAGVWNAGRNFYKKWALTSMFVLGATSGGSPVVALSKNALLEALADAKPTSGHPNQLMTTLEDGTRVIFRKDFGEQAHSIGGPFQGQGRIDHYNIEVQSATGRTIENVHAVPDGSNGFIFWGKDGVIKQ